jgi:hypothetical protein
MHEIYSILPLFFSSKEPIWSINSNPKNRLKYKVKFCNDVRSFRSLCVDLIYTEYIFLLKDK